MKLELQLVISNIVDSGSQTNTLNHWAISPAPHSLVKNNSLARILSWWDFPFNVPATSLFLAQFLRRLLKIILQVVLVSSKVVSQSWAFLWNMWKYVVFNWFPYLAVSLFFKCVVYNLAFIWESSLPSFLQICFSTLTLFSSWHSNYLYIFYNYPQSLRFSVLFFLFVFFSSELNWPVFKLINSFFGHIQYLTSPSKACSTHD